MRGQIDGVVEKRSGRVVLRNWASTHARDAAAREVDIHFSFVQGGLQAMGIASKILQQVDRNIEADDVSFVFVSEDLLEEGAANLLFHVDHIALAAAGIDQDA